MEGFQNLQDETDEFLKKPMAFSRWRKIAGEPSKTPQTMGQIVQTCRDKNAIGDYFLPQYVQASKNPIMKFLIYFVYQELFCLLLGSRRRRSTTLNLEIPMAMGSPTRHLEAAWSSFRARLNPGRCSLYLDAMITGMGIFIGCGYGYHTGIVVATLSHTCFVSQICSKTSSLQR
jgi:hypothetical protein